MNRSTFSRRTLLGMALGAGVVVLGTLRRPGQTRSRAGSAVRLSAAVPPCRWSTATRRKNVTDSLVAIDEQILPVLKTKKYVVIKPNMVSTVNPLAATNADALLGILDYLGPRFKGPVYHRRIVGRQHAGRLRQFQVPQRGERAPLAEGQPARSEPGRQV